MSAISSILDAVSRFDSQDIENDLTRRIGDITVSRIENQDKRQQEIHEIKLDEARWERKLARARALKESDEQQLWRYDPELKVQRYNRAGQPVDDNGAEEMGKLPDN